MVLNHASLFSGIGGFDLAAEWAGYNNIFQIEKDKYCLKILNKNFPNVKKYKEIREFNGTKYKGKIDILTGGFPCQPFSLAGKRNGENDDRYLWPEMLRIIEEIKPSIVIGENVSGIVTMENGNTLDGILSGLESKGYKTETYDIPASAVGAWHKRSRIWIVAYLPEFRNRSISIFKRNKRQKSVDINRKSKDVSDTDKIRLQGNNGGKHEQLIKIVHTNVSDTDSKRASCVEKSKPAKNAWKLQRSKRYRCWSFEPHVGRVANGISSRMDRIKGLGNAIVPQVAYEFFLAINKTLLL